MLGEYGLGMKLYALHRQCAMAHTHDFTIVSPGGDFKLCGQRSAFYGQRVVTVDRIGLRQVSENALLCGVYDAGFAGINCWARMMRPPKAAPMLWCPRHTPSMGNLPAKCLMAATEIPASAGEHGPGDTTRCVGA